MRIDIERIVAVICLFAIVPEFAQKSAVISRDFLFEYHFFAEESGNPAMGRGVEPLGVEYCLRGVEARIVQTVHDCGVRALTRLQNLRISKCCTSLFEFLGNVVWLRHTSVLP